MTRAEFMEVLQRSLSGSLRSSSVNDHMRYYQEYFDIQLSLGKSETEIAGELGNPRLLAKTIIEAAKREGRGENVSQYDEIYENEDKAAKERKNLNPGQYRMPGWLWAVLILVAVVAVVGVINSVIVAMLPVLFPMLCVVLLLRLFKRK